MTLIRTHSQNIDSGIFQQPLIRSCCNFAQSYKAQKEEDWGDSKLIKTCLLRLIVQLE